MKKIWKLEQKNASSNSIALPSFKFKKYDFSGIIKFPEQFIKEIKKSNGKET